MQSHLSYDFISLMLIRLSSSLCSSCSKIVLSENSIGPEEREVVANKARALCRVRHQLDGLATKLVDVAELKSLLIMPYYL